MLHARGLPGNPYDGHSLGTIIEATEMLTGCAIERAYVGKGCRRNQARLGHGLQNNPRLLFLRPTPSPARVHHFQSIQRTDRMAVHTISSQPSGQPVARRPSSEAYTVPCRPGRYRHACQSSGDRQ
ncbi:hypothetical protein ACVWXO_000248 [Bradyrhizobium sp. LM2.7]